MYPAFRLRYKRDEKQISKNNEPTDKYIFGAAIMLAALIIIKIDST